MAITTVPLGNRHRSIVLALGAVVALVLGLLAGTGTSARAGSTGGSGGAYADATFQPYTASNGLTGQYHLYAAGLDTSKSIGLMVQFHGDGAYEFNNPNSSYSLGGTTGIRAQAKRHNMILIAAKAPDTQGTTTWWESGSQNADFARDLIRAVAYARFPIDTERVWLNGYSGGAQFVTQYLMPKHSSLFDGGGAVVFGGGGTPRVTVQPFAAGLKPDFPMHWYTGADDVGGSCSEGYNALRDAQNGSAYYRGQGFPATLETPAGVCHNLSGRFGPVTGQQLDLHDSVGAPPSPTPTATPTPTPTPTATATATPTPTPSPSGTFVPWQHTLTVGRTSVSVVVDIPSTSTRTTFRISRSPFGTQTGTYSYTTRTGNDVTIRISETLRSGTLYYYQLETGRNRSVVASGTFTTLP